MNIKKTIKETVNKKVVITEARGIAESTIPYTHASINEIDKQIDYYFKNIFKNKKYLKSVEDMRVGGYLPAPDYSTKIIIPYRTLAKYIDDDIFEDFPVVALNITLKFIYINEESGTNDNFGVGGGAWPIFKGKSTTLSQSIKPEGFPVSKVRRESIDRAVIGELEFDFNFYKNFSSKRNYKNFHREVRAVIFHEMMHLYESYKDKSSQVHTIHKGVKSKKPKSKGSAGKAYLTDTKLLGIPNEVNEVMKLVYHMYYVSLPTEVKAITHEMYPYVLDMSIPQFFKSYQGKRVKGLMEFDADDYYEQLEMAVGEYLTKIGKAPNEEVINSFLEQVRMRTLKKYKRSATDNHEFVDEKLIKQKSMRSLLHYMGKQINNGGQRLFRNVGRLYSLKSEL